MALGVHVVLIISTIGKSTKQTSRGVDSESEQSLKLFVIVCQQSQILFKSPPLIPSPSRKEWSTGSFGVRQILLFDLPKTGDVHSRCH